MGNNCCTSTPNGEPQTKTIDSADKEAVKWRRQERKASIHRSILSLGPKAEGLTQHYQTEIRKSTYESTVYTGAVFEQSQP